MSVVEVPFIVSAAEAEVTPLMLIFAASLAVIIVVVATPVWPKSTLVALLAVKRDTVALPISTVPALFTTITPPLRVPVMFAPLKFKVVTLAALEIVTLPPIVARSE